MNKVYLSGEIHSEWRNKIINLSNQSKLNIEFLTPELDHDTSDLIGSRILGDEESSFWTDRKSALINSIKISANYAINQPHHPMQPSHAGVIPQKETTE